MLEVATVVGLLVQHPMGRLSEAAEHLATARTGTIHPELSSGAA
jgi:hypothetical protein